MSKIAEIGKMVRSHLVGAQLGSDADESKEIVSEAIQPGPETVKVRSRRPVVVGGQPGSQDQVGDGSAAKDSHAQDVTSTKVQKKASKQETVLGLLRRDDGATIDELIDATAWQTHSVRGFLSGTVRKKLKLNLMSDVIGNGVRRYRVGAAEDTDAAPEADQSLSSSPPYEQPVTDGASAEQAD